MTVVVTSPIPVPDIGSVGTIANPQFVPSTASLLGGGLTALAGIVTGGIAAKRAGLTGVDLQADIIRNTVLSAISAVPGVGILSLVEPVVRLLGLEPTLPEFQRQELRENPDYISPSARLELIQQQNVLSIQARQAADARRQEALARERARFERQTAEALRARRLQSVPFQGVPGIFTRLRREVM